MSKKVSKDKKEFSRNIAEMRNDELRRATNLVGPHRDDFIFVINNYELRKFGSQGQHKTFQIALRFGEFFYLLDKLGKKPIFLLDDVFGELDTFRAGKISEFLEDVGQAFITLTDFAKLDKLNFKTSANVINIEMGKVSYA